MSRGMNIKLNRLAIKVKQRMEACPHPAEEVVEAALEVAVGGYKPGDMVKFCKRCNKCLAVNGQKPFQQGS